MDDKQHYTDDGRLIDALPADAPERIKHKHPSPLHALIAGDTSEAVTNFPGTDRDRLMFVLKAESGDVIKGDDVKGQPISIVFFYAHRVRMVNDRTGEFTEPLRVVLFDKDGLGVSFVSDTVARGLMRIVEFCGMGPYDPPVVVKVVEAKTGSGYKTKTIVPV